MILKLDFIKENNFGCLYIILRVQIAYRSC